MPDFGAERAQATNPDLSSSSADTKPTPLPRLGSETAPVANYDLTIDDDDDRKPPDNKNNDVPDDTPRNSSREQALDEDELAQANTAQAPLAPTLFTRNPAGGTGPLPVSADAPQSSLGSGDQLGDPEPS